MAIFGVSYLMGGLSGLCSVYLGGIFFIYGLVVGFVLLFLLFLYFILGFNRIFNT